MARTFGGLVLFGANGIAFTASAGTVTYTRNAADSNVSLNMAASTTAFFNCSLDYLRRPYFTFPSPPGQGTVLTSNEFQELFGTAAGGPSNPFSGGGSALSSVFETPNNPWGLAIIDIFAIYSVVTNPLTTATISLFRNTFAENVAFTTATLVNATGISTAVTANANSPHVQKVALAQPIVFEAVDNSDLLISLDLVTPAGGTAQVFGIGLHVAAEFS